MQAVQLDRGHGIQMLEYEVLPEEMAGNVEHHAPVGKTRRVLDLAESDLPEAAVQFLLAHSGGHRKSLAGIETAGGVGTGDHYSFLADLQPVSLWAEGRILPVNDVRPRFMAVGAFGEFHGGRSRDHVGDGPLFHRAGAQCRCRNNQ